MPKFLKLIYPYFSETTYQTKHIMTIFLLYLQLCRYVLFPYNIQIENLKNEQQSRFVVQVVLNLFQIFLLSIYIFRPINMAINSLSLLHLSHYLQKKAYLITNSRANQDSPLSLNKEKSHSDLTPKKKVHAYT